MPNTLAYILDGKVYINLTNGCTNNCVFCLRNDKSDVCGQEMWLENEDFNSQDVIEQLNKFPISDEVIFCGYGEPMLKLDILKEVAKYIKENYPKTKIRVNTNGHANYIYKRNVLPELKGLIDEFSVSLNGKDAQQYDELSKPNFEGAFEEVKNFIKESANEDFLTVASVVDGYKGQHLDIETCEKIAKNLGAKFRVREWIKNGYS